MNPSTIKSRKPSYESIMRDRFAEARSAIVTSVVEQRDDSEEVDLSKAYALSTQLLGRYVTLDFDHWKAVRGIRSLISRYADDRSRRRPLNILMQAEPGSGKSHLVKSLAHSLEKQNASAVDYNMASLQSLEDLLQPLDAVRNLKVQDKLPILFIDEFDSDPARYPLLLPLLWEGELNIAHRNLKLGKLVVILAGSGKTISSAMATAKSMQLGQAAEGKLVDLLSRINGGELEIPPLDLFNAERDRRTDKVCLTVSLIEARFGTEVELLPRSLLSFVARSRFRYGVRSLAHLVDFIDPFAVDDTKVEITTKQLRLPLTSVSALRASSLAYHVFSEDGPAAIIDCWKEASNEEARVRIRQAPEEEEA